VRSAEAQALHRRLDYQHVDIPPYQVTWNYLDKVTGETKQEGELCGFWMKALAR
jgi:hypothetical protein